MQHLDEDDGSYFIDRDGRHFHYVLSYLRSPAQFDPPTDATVLRELSKEAEYYKLVGHEIYVMSVSRSSSPS